MNMFFESNIRKYFREVSWQNIILVLAIFSLLAFLFIQTQVVNIVEHNRYNSELLRLKEEDALFNQDIVKIRQGLILHYDPLVTDLQQIKQLLNNLEKIPKFIGSDEASNIQTQINEYTKTLKIKEELIESFKSQNAILKNSLSYFPILISESVSKINNQPGNQSLASDLNLFLENLLVYNLNYIDNLETKLKPQLANILKNQDRYGAILGKSNFDLIIVHARVVLTNKPQVDALIKELTSLPTLERNEAIYQAYTNHYKQAVDVASNYRLFLFLIILVLLGYVGYFIEIRRRIARQIKQTVEQVSCLVGENDDDIKKLSEEAYKQSQELIYTLSSVEQMALSIQSVANSATEAAAIATNSYQVAEKGGSAMEETVKNFFTLRDTLTETNQKIEHLTQSSLQISQIIALIEYIAKQTKILSVNASVEAVRAGKEGRGFKVIAEEISRLSLQTREGTDRIKQMVRGIQLDTQEVVRFLELGRNQILEGNNLVENTKQNLEQIIKISAEIDHLVKSISGATVSQAQTSQLVTELIKQVAELSERTSNSSRQVSSSLQETVLVAQKLQKSIS